MLFSCKLHLNEKKKETLINPITVKFRKFAPSLYFSKVLFEGFSFEGAYIRREISVSNRLSFPYRWK